MKWVSRIIQGLLTVGFAMSGVTKFTNPQTAEMFNELGYSAGFAILVGALEVAAAVGLLVGFWKPRLALLASGGLVLLMAGAVVSHLAAGHSMGNIAPSFILMLLSLILAIAKRKVFSQAGGQQASTSQF